MRQKECISFWGQGAFGDTEHHPMGPHSPDRGNAFSRCDMAPHSLHRTGPKRFVLHWHPLSGSENCLRLWETLVLLSGYALLHPCHLPQPWQSPFSRRCLTRLTRHCHVIRDAPLCRGLHQIHSSCTMKDIAAMIKYYRFNSTVQVCTCP